MQMFSNPDEQSAPSHTAPEDIAFFTLHPARQFRARPPTRRELQNARKRGHVLVLGPGQSWAVIVTRVVGGPIITTLGKVRLDLPGVYPDSDDDIRGAFNGPRPVAPAGVAA